MILKKKEVYSSTTAQPSQGPELQLTKNDAVLTPSTAGLGNRKAIQMTFPDQFGENWMDTRHNGNVKV